MYDMVNARCNDDANRISTQMIETLTKNGVTAAVDYLTTFLLPTSAKWCLFERGKVFTAGRSASHAEAGNAGYAPAIFTVL
jgi:hypothetical protein